MGLRFRKYVGAIEKCYFLWLFKSLTLAFLAHSLLAMLVTPENLNPVRRRGGEKKEKNLLLVMPNPICIVLYSLIAHSIFSVPWKPDLVDTGKS